MEIRECTADDVISLLHTASDNKETRMFDNWAQHQKWILDAVYSNKYQVLIADDGYGVVGYLVWSLTQICFKWEAYLHHIYVSKDFRGTEVSDKLVLKFIHNCYNSSAQRLKFDTLVLPQRWIDLISANAPLDKYTTYHIERTDELKRWYNEDIQKYND
jgi:ribosomal protein S18 acetylase RimI-like enzyme